MVDLFCGAIAAAGLVITVAALVWLHLVPSGLSPMRNPVSQYGISKYRTGYRVATISLGATAAALATGIGELSQGHGTEVVVALLVMFALARLVISWFPMDRPGAPRTGTGTAHGLIAIVTFAAATAAALRLAAITGRLPAWHSLALVSLIFGCVMVAGILGMLARRLTPQAGRFFGGFERVLYVAIIDWFAVLAATLLTTV